MQNTSPNKVKLSLKMTILSLLGVCMLAGCGIRGDLKTPPPLFGAESTVDPDRVPTGDLDAGNDEDDFDPLLDPSLDTLADE